MVDNVSGSSSNYPKSNSRKRSLPPYESKSKMPYICPEVGDFDETSDINSQKPGPKSTVLARLLYDSATPTIDEDSESEQSDDEDLDESMPSSSKRSHTDSSDSDNDSYVDQSDVIAVSGRSIIKASKRHNPSSEGPSKPKVSCKHNVIYHKLIKVIKLHEHPRPSSRNSGIMGVINSLSFDQALEGRLSIPVYQPKVGVLQLDSLPEFHDYMNSKM